MTERAAPQAEVVLDAVRGLLRELHDDQTPPPVSLDSALDRELGLDSLALAELRLRLEDAAGVRLPDDLLSSAETPRDFLRALGRDGEPVTETAPPTAGPPAEEIRDVPEDAGTLMDVLRHHAGRHPDNRHITIVGEGPPEHLAYGELLREAESVAAGLAQRGVAPGDTVALMLPTGRSYFTTFFGTLLAGGVPVPLYPPARLAQLEEHLRRQVRILDNARAVLLITVPEARRMAGLVRGQARSLRGVVTPDELSATSPEPRRVERRPEDVAFLQYTSGSTGDPKGVVLTHANLLANIRAIADAVELRPDDVAVSWLPLYHDMGLIGVWLTPLYGGIPLVVMSPLHFLARPSRWLRTIHEHRGTLTASPNFGYELCVRRIPDQELEGLDLSSWRVAGNGAEPVSPDTMDRFADRLRPYGFTRKALMPLYGLAECTVGLTFPPSGRGPVVDRVDREAFIGSGRATPAAPDDPNPLRFVSSGSPLAGHQVRIVGPGGKDLPERHQGGIRFRGPSATSGYHRNPRATRELMDGDWLDSGDLGYVADGELYVTGRVKDLIIRAGRNIHPAEIENVVGDLDGVRAGRVAAFAAADPQGRTERLVVLAETQERDEDARGRLQREIRGLTVDLVGVPPDDVVLAPPGTVPKTSSGKIRRAASREMYEEGRIGAARRAVWLQVARLGWAEARARARRGVRAAGRGLYAAYAWVVLALVAPPAWLMCSFLPRASWRWRVFRGAARLLLGATGLRVTVHGRERLPEGGRVVVANHGSFLDGVVLARALPGHLTFAAARVFAGRKIAGPFLRGIGARFVEREDRSRAVVDALALADVVRSGGSLVAFPEGRMAHAPGLQPFRTGAFAVAAEAGIPVVPVGIRGTRALLPPGRWWYLRPGRVEVRVGHPVTPSGDGWSGAVALQRRTRPVLLRLSGEPDLRPSGGR